MSQILGVQRGNISDHLTAAQPTSEKAAKVGPSRLLFAVAGEGLCDNGTHHTP